MIEQYKRDGYVVVPNVVDPLGVSKDGLYEALSFAHAESETAYRLSCRLLASHVGTIGMFLSPWLIEAVLDLGIEEPIFLTSVVAHVMAPDLWNEGAVAHQDWPALQSGLDTVVAWIPLFDVGLDDYPVEVVPGSHLLGLLPSKEVKDGAAVVDTSGMNFVPVTMKRGDALLFSAFTVHRTRTPGTGLRAAFSHRFENAADPWFKAHDGYSAQRRTIDREARWTPTLEQVRKAFT
jgi:ectoine hydroxylase-related dioxygenase (phytanoyl-CoA dioxygenase family)